LGSRVNLKVQRGHSTKILRSALIGGGRVKYGADRAERRAIAVVVVELWFSATTVELVFNHSIRRTLTKTENAKFSALSHNQAQSHRDKNLNMAHECTHPPDQLICRAGLAEKIPRVVVRIT